MASPTPFYIQVTPVKEDFINKSGTRASVDLPLVTLPAGTLLFRGLKIPNAAEGDDIRYFYRDFLGDPEAGGKVCLSPVHNVFFYPFPYIAFGAVDVGQRFTMFQIVVLVHPVTVVAAMSPSTFVRGMAKRYDGEAPWQRCSNFTGKDIDCHPPTAQEKEARTFDNCLNPAYQAKSGVRGWMAIANLDSLNPIKKGANTPTTPMKEFVKRLETLLPGQGAQAIANAYTDDQRHAGYPEIALYPYKEHKGRGTITRSCPNDLAAMSLIEKEATADNLNYLPIATFTKNGIFDMVNGDYNYQILQPTPNAFSPEGAQEIIIQNLFTYMNKLKTEGIDLPFYGKAQLYFDSRTGFFVLNKIVPQSLRIQIPKAVQNAERVSSTTSYQSILMPLKTEDDNRRMNIYSLMFRNFLPETYMTKYGLEKGYGFRRSMIFNRYPVLTNIFRDLEMPIPAAFKEPLDRAGKLYAKETGRTAPVTRAAPAAAAAAPAALPPIKTPYVPKAFEDEVEGVNYYKYANVTPPAASASASANADADAAAAADEESKTPPFRGGKGKGKSRRRRRAPARQTRKRKQDKQEPVKKYTTLFTKVWKIHGKRKA